MSPDCKTDPHWQKIKKHRKATCRDWDNGKARKMSAKPLGPSQYYPYSYSTDDAIELLEMRCYRDGTPVRHAFARYLDELVGVCKGDETQYVFAECCSGFVHGRPISVAALQLMGVTI